MFVDKEEDFLAADARHFHVEEDDIIDDFLDEVDGFDAIEGEVDFVRPRFFQFFLEEGGKGGFVVDYQDFITLRHVGSSLTPATFTHSTRAR